MPTPKDFSQSAVNLVNPPEVKELLEKLSDEQLALNTLNAELGIQNKELLEKIDAQSSKVADLGVAIRKAVEKHGSYQDTENERYGVQYERKLKVYDLNSFKHHFPKFVELCVKEAIDVTALEGQIKGKLITVEELERKHVLTYDIGYAFYVR